MKKFTLIAALLISAFAANAQTFTLDRDTSKGYFSSAGIPVDTKIKVTNTGTSPLAVSWSVFQVIEGVDWHMNSICEPNGECYTADKPGMKDGFTTFTPTPIPAGSSYYFIVDYDADKAAPGTSASTVINVTFDGTTTKKLFFNGYKSTTGISTTLKSQDDITIFPNPANNYIDVLYNAASDVKTIAIYNLIGKVVNVYKVTDKNSARCEFNVDMPSGIYLVRIADSKGNIIATRKITHQ